MWINLIHVESSGDPCSMFLIGFLNVCSWFQHPVKVQQTIQNEFKTRLTHVQACSKHEPQSSLNIAPKLIQTAYNRNSKVVWNQSQIHANLVQRMPNMNSKFIHIQCVALFPCLAVVCAVFLVAFMLVFRFCLRRISPSEPGAESTLFLFS